MSELQRTSAMKKPPAAALLVFFVIGVHNIGEAWGQDVDVNDTAIDEILVTGSNVRNRRFSTPSPIAAVDRDDMQSFSSNQLRDLLKAIPSNTGSIFQNVAGNLAGTSQFNLRALGLSSTLTLVNGRRAGVAAVGEPTGSDWTDINQFPLAMVDRVEILKDGASAIYGSEAVAGVSNIITRKGFEGIELSGEYADALNQTWSMNLAAGKRFDGGSFNIYATYYEQSRINRLGIDWIDERINGNGNEARSRLLSSQGNPGTFRRADFNANGDPIGLAGGQLVADPDCEAGGGVFRQNDDGSIDTSLCRHVFGGATSTIWEIERLQAFAEFEYAFSDRATYFAEASFSDNRVIGDNGPLNHGAGLAADNPAGAVFVPAEHPFNFFIEDPTDSTNILAIDPAVWDNAMHQSVPLVAILRPLGREFHETGENIFDNVNQFSYARLVNGLDIQLSDNWDATVSHMLASADVSIRESFWYAMDAYNQLVLDGVWNPFGTRVAHPDLVSPKDGVSIAGTSDIGRFTTPAVTNNRTEQNVVDLVASGDLWDPGTGMIGAAIGAQYRHLELELIPDSLKASGEGRFTSLEFPVFAAQEVWAAFGEAIIPFHDRAELQLALRHEDYGDFGTSTDPKVAVKYHATDWLSVRGSWGTAFQAPAMRQTATTLTAQLVNDPAISGPGPNNAVCAPPGTGTSAINVNVKTSGDDDLTAQSSDNFNIGLVLQPTDNLNLSVDFWNYEYDDLIAPGENAQTIVANDCNDGIVDDPRVIRDSSGQLNEVRTSFTNIGSVETNGIDLDFTYSLPSSALGDISLYGVATFINKFDVDDGSGVVFDGAGSRNFTNSFSVMPEWRANVGASWSRGNHSANLAVRYIDGYENDQSNGAPIDEFVTVDLQYGLNVSNVFGVSEASFVVGIDNLFDQDPPGLVRFDSNGELIRGTITDYDRPSFDERAGHDIRGRVGYVRATIQF